MACTWCRTSPHLVTPSQWSSTSTRAVSSALGRTIRSGTLLRARSWTESPTIFIDLGRLPGTESRHGDEKPAQMHSSSILLNGSFFWRVILFALEVGGPRRE